jgi:hypothetical protein
MREGGVLEQSKGREKRRRKGGKEEEESVGCDLELDGHECPPIEKWMQCLNLIRVF